MDKEAADNFAQTLPIPRVGKPEEIAALVAFLSSENGGYTVIFCIDIALCGDYNKCIFGGVCL